MDELSAVERRISELNSKASQLLTALGFAIAAGILLEHEKLSTCEAVALRWSLRFWVLSIFPVLAIIAPIKEFRGGDEVWYRRVRMLKVGNRREDLRRTRKSLRRRQRALCWLQMGGRNRR